MRLARSPRQQAVVEALILSVFGCFKIDARDTSSTASRDSQHFRQVVSAAGTKKGAHCKLPRKWPHISACIRSYPHLKILLKKELVGLDSERPFVHTGVWVMQTPSVDFLFNYRKKGCIFTRKKSNTRLTYGVADFFSSSITYVFKGNDSLLSHQGKRLTFYPTEVSPPQRQGVYQEQKMAHLPDDSHDTAVNMLDFNSLLFTIV